MHPECTYITCFISTSLPICIVVYVCGGCSILYLSVLQRNLLDNFVFERSDLSACSLENKSGKLNQNMESIEVGSAQMSDWLFIFVLDIGSVLCQCTSGTRKHKKKILLNAPVQNNYLDCRALNFLEE